MTTKTTKAKVKGAPAVGAPVDVVPELLNAKVTEGNKTVYAVQGIDVAVDNDFYDDFELFAELDEIEQNPFKIAVVLKRIAGAEQARKIYNHLRDEKTGRVSVEKGTQFVLDLIETIAPNS